MIKMQKSKIEEAGRKIPDIILFDNLKALKEAEKEALFFTLDKNMCNKAKERGLNCRSPDDYIDSKDLETQDYEFDLMREWLSKLTTYDDINLGLLMQSSFIHLEANQKFRIYKILKELIAKEKPNSIKVVTKGKPIYRWTEVGDPEIPVGLTESMADNEGIDFKLEYIGLTTPLKNKVFRSAAPFLLWHTEKLTEHIIRIKRGNITKNANAKVMIYLNNTYNLHVIEPVLKYLSEQGVELLIIIQSHGFFNFGLSKREYKHLQDLGTVRSFESYQNNSIYKIVSAERKRLKKAWNEIKGDVEFQKNFLLDNVNVWKAFEDSFWFYYAVQFPRLVKYIETDKRILEIEKPEAIVFKAGGQTCATVAERFGIPTILETHGYISPRKQHHLRAHQYFAVWGPKIKEYMVSIHGLNKEQVTVTGAPHYDALTKLKSKDKLRKELGLPESKLIVTFATQPFSDEIRKKLTHETLRSVKELKNVLLVIKPHPIENPKFYSKFLREFDTDISSDKKVMLMPGVNISKLLKASDLLLTVHSTVVLAANIIGTPVLTLNFTEQKDFYYSKEGGAVGVENPETLTEMICKALYDEKFKEKMSINRNEFLQKYTFNEDGRATERETNLVMRVIEESKKKKGLK